MITAPETPRRRSGSPTVELADDLASLRDDWERLADAGRNLFGTWEWSELWWRHFGGERPLRIAVSRDDDGEIAALVPLFVWSPTVHSVQAGPTGWRIPSGVRYCRCDHL